MKTLTTAKGFEYDLEVVSIFNGVRIEVLATCENGSETFVLDFDTTHGKITDDNVNEFLDDADLSKIETWVDATESAWVVSEIQKICVQKGDLSFSVNAFGKFAVTVLKWSLERISVVDSINLTTLEEMNDYINGNK